VLKEEFNHANSILGIVARDLNPESELPADWANSLKNLKALTDNGFYPTTVIYSRNINNEIERKSVQDLISDYWQLLWQAREIAPLMLGKNYAGDAQYKLNTLLVDISSAVDQSIQRDNVCDTEEAVKVSQISYGLGAALGDEGALSEIRASEEEDPLKLSDKFFTKFLDTCGDSLSNLGVTVQVAAR
jgi:hypothetical protein